MNTIQNDCAGQCPLWHDRMLQGCQEVIQCLTVVLLRLKRSQLLALDEPLPLTVFVESPE
jgi:hypothetical protein